MATLHTRRSAGPDSCCAHPGILEAARTAKRPAKARGKLGSNARGCRLKPLAGVINAQRNVAEPGRGGCEHTEHRAASLGCRGRAALDGRPPRGALRPGPRELPRKAPAHTEDGSTACCCPTGSNDAALRNAVKKPRLPDSCLKVACYAGTQSALYASRMRTPQHWEVHPLALAAVVGDSLQG